jgi:hypothetical protein
MYIMYSNNVMYRLTSAAMPAPHSVKARGRQGTSSLDLTIPTELKREYRVSEGDVFIVNVDDEGENMKITYERVHQVDS